MKIILLDSPNHNKLGKQSGIKKTKTKAAAKLYVVAAKNPAV